MDEGSIALVLAAAVVVCLIVFGVPHLGLRRQAARDFKRARGTQHRALVDSALEKVNARIVALKDEHARSVASRARLDLEEVAEIDRALAHHLVSTRLTEVPGIGRKRADAIKSLVLVNSLADLHQASWKVEGIGSGTQSSISTWVNGILGNWSAIRQTSFPEKQAITDRYATRRQALLDAERRLNERLARLNDLVQTAQGELTKLGQPDVDAFAAALRRSRKAQPAELERYVIGIFPPWSPPPSWFAELLRTSQHGDTAALAR